MVCSDGCYDSTSFDKMTNGPNFVSFNTEDRQWDCRFNVQTDESLDELLTAIKSDYNGGQLKYILVGGLEIGTRPYQDDYQIRHVHVAAMFHNRVSKRRILNTWNIKTGNGYYLVPRKRDLPTSGWRAHHIKEFSKVDPSKCILFEMGDLPQDHATKGESYVKRSEQEKKRKLDDVLIEMKGMIEKDESDEAFKKFPRTYLQYGEKLKAMIHQTKDSLFSEGHPHIWLYGSAGYGKSAILSYIYPQTYKKNLYNRFFDLYDPKLHSHVMLEDLDHDAVDKLSLNFLKTLCDESGFAIDQKYKTPQLTRATILVTSNFGIDDVVNNSTETNQNSRKQNRAALLRRFWHINVVDFLRLLQVKLLPSYELQQLKKSGNKDPAKVFYTYDYLTQTPLCRPLETPEYYQKLIKDTFYAMKG